MAWLSTVARNAAIDEVRAQCRYARSIEDPFWEETAPDAETPILQAEINARLHKLLGSLREHQREAIRRAFFDDTSYPELAASYGVPLGTMKSWVRRGLREIRARLNDEDQIRVGDEGRAARKILGPCLPPGQKKRAPYNCS